MLPIDSEKTLETTRLFLEPLCENHAELLFPALSDLNIYKFIPEDPLELEALRERYRGLQIRCSPKGDELWLNWALRIKGSETYLGYVQATLREDQTSDFAYVLGSAFWKQGYASEACQRVLELLFESYSMTQMTARVDTRNQASCRLIERLGFTRVALHSNVDFFKGCSSDEYEYCLSNQTFNQSTMV
jgi:[ribosomal protein S5]-alanine N-acetyltransferase